MNVQPFFDPFPTIDLGDIILREITKEDAQAYLDYMSNDQMAGFLTNENKFTNEIFEHEGDSKQVLNTKTKPYYWIGKDYANTYREDFKDIHEFSRGIILRLNKRLKLFLLIQTKYINYHFTDQFDRETIPRMTENTTSDFLNHIIILEY